jgi:hypothetical protein
MEENKTSFAIVEFNGEKVEAVPEVWLTSCERNCFWPPYRSSLQLSKAIQSCEEVDETRWSLHEVVRVMGRAGMKS